MKTLIAALAVALFSGSAIASDAASWGGDLDGQIEHYPATSTGPIVQFGDRTASYAHHTGLNGDFEVHNAGTSDPLPGFRLTARDIMGADLDGGMDI